MIMLCISNYSLVIQLALIILPCPKLQRSLFNLPSMLWKSWVITSHTLTRTSLLHQCHNLNDVLANRWYQNGHQAIYHAVYIWLKPCLLGNNILAFLSPLLWWRKYSSLSHLSWYHFWINNHYTTGCVSFIEVVHSVQWFMFVLWL